MRDPFGDYGRLEGKAAHDQLSDNITFLKVLLGIAILPVWLPLWLHRRQARRSEMIEFSQSIAVRGARDYREIGLRWVLAHPDEYVLGQYDPRLPKIQSQFRKIIARQNRRLPPR